MDCRSFRKHHLAYLDDTLSGDQMSAAQRHILACDACAAHDTLVRRSLLLARNVPMVEPSREFRAKLRERLDACRAGDIAPPLMDRPPLTRAPRYVAVIAMGAVLGTIAWSNLPTADAPVVAMQPVVATQPSMPGSPYVSPALMQAMATGNPVWPAAMILDEMPTQFVAASYSMSEDLR